MARVCILVLHDMHMIGGLYEKMLRSSGYQYVSFYDVKDAADFLTVNHSRIDLVLVDLVMSGTNWAEIAKQMAVIDPEMPVIIVAEHLVDQEIGANLRTVLYEPVLKTELLQTVQKHMRRPPISRRA